MAQLIGIDEYGRPIIVMKGQENQERLTGVAALKVSFREKRNKCIQCYTQYSLYVCV